MQPFAPRMLDIFSASDEIEMLRYRLRLHEPIAYRTIILEANYTHTGHPKPLYVRNALSAEEIARHRITLVSVPFTADEVRRSHCKARACLLVLEDSQRRFVNSLIAAELASLRASGSAHDVLVHMSDVDELVDLEAVSRLRLQGCASALLRMFAYGERCPALSPQWAKSVIFNASSGWFEKAVAANPNLQLRKLARQCPVTSEYVGWHFSYFLPTRQILSKLSTFSHATESFIQRIIHSADPNRTMDDRIRRCTSVHGRAYGPAWASFDGKLPTLPGLPRHPLAPAHFTREQMLREESRHAESVAKCKPGSRGCDFARGRLEATRNGLLMLNRRARPEMARRK